MSNEWLVPWIDVRDALPDKRDIYLLTSCCHPGMAAGTEEEEGDSVIIALYEGDGRWRRRNAVYQAEKHITAWAEVPAGYKR